LTRKLRVFCAFLRAPLQNGLYGFVTSKFGVEMAKANLSTKPHVNVGTIGHVDHGKPR
jgi:GTPase